jgi:hypothetical protein
MRFRYIKGLFNCFRLYSPVSNSWEIFFSKLLVVNDLHEPFRRIVKKRFLFLKIRESSEQDLHWSSVIRAFWKIILKSSQTWFEHDCNMNILTAKSVR